MVRYYKFDELLNYCLENILMIIPNDLGQIEKVQAQKLYDKYIMQKIGVKIVDKIKSQPCIYILSDGDGNEVLRICPSLYPYYTDSSAEFLIWIWEPELITLTQASSLLKALGVENHIIWENPEHRKSVPEIKHYHVLVKDIAPEI